METFDVVVLGTGAAADRRHPQRQPPGPALAVRKSRGSRRDQRLVGGMV